MIRHQTIHGRSAAGIAGLLLLAVGCGTDNNTQAPTVPPPDQAPPLTPLGMAVGKANDVAFSFGWAKNSEADLGGYRVYAYYPDPSAESSYRLVNPDHLITENHYAAQVELNPDGSTPYEIYVRVSAVDLSGNESGLSSACRIPLLPNVLPVDSDPGPDQDNSGGGGSGGGSGGTTGQGPGKEPSDDPPSRN